MEVKLKLKIKDVEIELSEKEVGELRDILKKLFPEPSITYVPYYPYKWVDPWSYGHWTTYCAENIENNCTVYTTELSNK